MKYLLFSICMVLTFSFCQNNKNTNEIAKKDAVFKLSEHYSKFKFHDLKEFERDTFGFDERRKQYKELDSIEEVQIIQGSKALTEYDHGTFFYYSTFADSTLIALMQETSDENGVFILLLKYDKNGKLQGSIPIAGSWGDAGESYNYKGKLLKNNTFMTTHVYWSMVGDDIETADQEIDSVILKIKFDTNSKIKIDTILSKIDTIKQSTSN